MGIMYSELNFELIIKDLENCCLKEEHCGSCVKSDCIIGFAQNSLTTCFKEDITYGNSEEIPVTDLKIYKEEEFEKGIAHILQQCRSCKEDHFDNCIVNIIRNCYEIGLFGEIQEYTGSSFEYLTRINEEFSQKASYIMEEFTKKE